MNLDELNQIESLSDGRYKSRSIVGGFSIDKEIAEEPCDFCGEKREYRQVFDDGSYRAFSVCHNCDDVMEF